MAEPAADAAAPADVSPPAEIKRFGIIYNNQFFRLNPTSSELDPQNGASMVLLAQKVGIDLGWDASKIKAWFKDLSANLWRARQMALAKAEGRAIPFPLGAQPAAGGTLPSAATNAPRNGAVPDGGEAAHPEPSPEGPVAARTRSRCARQPTIVASQAPAEKGSRKRVRPVAVEEEEPEAGPSTKRRVKKARTTQAPKADAGQKKDGGRRRNGKGRGAGA